MGKKKINELDNNKYCKIISQDEKYTVNINDLHEIISDLRIEYMQKYRREPQVLVIPEYVYYILDHYLATSYVRVPSNIDHARTYMGMLIIPTPAIKYYEYMKVY